MSLAKINVSCMAHYELHRRFLTAGQMLTAFLEVMTSGRQHEQLLINLLAMDFGGRASSEFE